MPSESDPTRVEALGRKFELKRLTYVVDTQVPFDGPQTVESGDGGWLVIGAIELSQRDP